MIKPEAVALFCETPFSSGLLGVALQFKWTSTEPHSRGHKRPPFLSGYNSLFLFVLILNVSLLVFVIIQAPIKW